MPQDSFDFFILRVTDQTVEICKRLGARVVKQEFLGHIEQKNYAISIAQYDHVLSLDADERLSEEAILFIAKVKKAWEYDGYLFNRLNNYLGAWLRYSWYPDRKLRLWNRKKGKWGGVNPHDKVILESDNVKNTKTDIIHYAYSTVNEHLEQISRFAEIAARAKRNKGKSASFVIHVVLSPWFKFVRKYVFNLGFLDGYYGFVYCCMASYLNFLKYVRLWQLEREEL